MTASPEYPHRVHPTPVASSLNVAFRWLLISSAVIFALTASIVITLPHPASTRFVSFLSWAAAISFLAGAISLLSIAVTEILKTSPTPEVQAKKSGEKPAPGVRLPLTFTFLGVVLMGYYGLHIFWWSPLTSVPEMTLGEIYAELNQMGEFSLVTVVVWGLIVAAGLAALTNIHEWLRGMASYTRLRALGFLSLALSFLLFILFLGWGFHVGMGLADTFMIYSGNNSLTSIPFGVAVLALGTLGIYGLFAPARTR